MVLLSVLTLCPLLANAGVRPELTEDERTRLEAGEVLIRIVAIKDGEGAVAARAIGLIDEPPARVWPHIDQCARYKEFMPRVVESRELKREGSRVDCFVKLDMPFPLADLWSKTEGRHDEIEGGYRRRWRFVEGPYKINQGSWTILPWTPAGDKSLGIYRIKVLTEMAVPPSFVRQGQRRSLPQLFEALRKRSKL